MGIITSIRKSHTRAKAEIKAAKVRAAKEVKARAKAEKQRAKILAKQEKNLLKAEQKGLKARRKHERKMAENQLKQIREGRIDKKSVKRYIGVSRALAVVAIPLLYRASVAVREKFEQKNAAKLGVSADKLAEFSGYGAGLKARIQAIKEDLKSSEALPEGFVKDATERLDTLMESVDNAEHMTPQKRSAAHQAISRDIDKVASEIQARLR